MNVFPRSSMPFLLFLGATCGGPAFASPAPPHIMITRTACEKLEGTTSGGLVVQSARYVPAGPLSTGEGGPNGEAPPPVAAPNHCLIEGVIEPRNGADGKPYAIGVQMRVPLEWNGRLMYQGGGGLDGVIGVAYGANSSHGSTAPTGLSRGFAVVTSDSGHSMGPDPQRVADFAQDQQARLNYAYQAIGKVASAAKATLSRLAGTGPERTYFVGCSNGGREALIAAGRFPLLFDGVSASNPAFDLSRAVLLARYSATQYRAAAVTAADLRLVGMAVLRQCDGLDGRRDGMIFDQVRCGFSVRSLQCSEKNKTSCLSATKMAAIERAFRGPLDKDGQPIFAAWTYDSGVGSLGWTAWQLGPLTSLVDVTIIKYFSTPPLLDGDLDKISLAQTMARMASIAAITDATSTDFSTFRARGGKLLLSTGWSDAIFAPSALIRWYESLQQEMAAQGHDSLDFARLFLVPGMTHCGGGASLDDFDALGTLVEWVERDRPPVSIVARGVAFPGESRPLCAYPAHAVYRAGDGKSAEAYTCER